MLGLLLPLLLFRQLRLNLRLSRLLRVLCFELGPLHGRLMLGLLHGRLMLGLLHGRLMLVLLVVAGFALAAR
jgi:hypothetical protein